MNQKGFIASSLLYGMLVLFLTLMLSTLYVFANNKLNMDRLKEKALDDAAPVIRYKYAINTTGVYPGTARLVDIGTTYNSCIETGKTICLKYVLEDDLLKSAQLCFVWENNIEHCLEASSYTYHQSNKSILQSVASASASFNCTDFGGNNTDKIECFSMGPRINIIVTHPGAAGGAKAYNSSWGCIAFYNGMARCGTDIDVNTLPY